MHIWSTFKFVPTIAPEALAWATVFLESAPNIAAFLCAVVFGGFAAFALFGTAEAAAKGLVVYYLVQALAHAGLAACAPQDLHRLSGTWGTLDTNAPRAVLWEAAGFVLIAATLINVWTLASPLAFAAMMSFGVIAMRVGINWVIVLQLLVLYHENDTPRPHSDD